MPRVRTVIAGLAAGVLLSGLAAPVAAQTTSSLSAAEAGSAAVTLTVAGSPALAIAETAAAAVPGQAAALGSPLALGGEPIGALSVESEGDGVAEDGCATPEVPAPLSALISGGVACAEVAADGDARTASATAGVAEAGVLSVDGADLGPLNELLTALPLDDLTDALADGIDDALEQTGLVEELQDGCVALLGALAADEDGGLLDDLLDPLTGIIAEVGDATGLEALSDALDDLFETIDREDAPLCATLDDLVEVLLGDDGLVGTITDGDLLDALATTDGVLDLTLLQTTSEVDRDGDTVSADAGPGDGAIRVTLDLPLLDELLGALLRDAVDAGVADLLAALDGALDELDGAVSEVPLLGEIISPLLTTGEVGAILDGPLLDVGVFPGSASAVGDLRELTTDGDSSPALVSLDGSLLNLPVLAGLDEALTAAADVVDREVLAALRDSPLAEVVAVELLPGEVSDSEIQGLAGTRATSGTANVTLLAALDDPLVDLQLAPAVAAVGVDQLTAPEPEPTPTPSPTPVTTAGPDPAPLPVTGAGAALFGLLALGAAGMLRRRG